ncbi:MAG: ABC transporter ATP-binding protein [Clostridia bacterium]|nr:ABC transporter ATP-binding protein [Clostridia bacterium]
MAILECRGLFKSYGSKRVLDNMNVSVPAGKIIGLLGPNGCGKSTLIKMICGLLVPDSGEILVDGIPAGAETNSLISYLPERTYLNPGMKVLDLIDYFKDFYPDFDAERALHMMVDLKIDPNARIRTLSKGTREKVQLIMVMSRNAKLYLLDEPIAGVDPASRDYILQTILQNYNPESSIIITTHLIYDIERVLDEFVFLGFGGQVVMSGNADDTRAQYGKTLDELFREVFRYVQ